MSSSAEGPSSPAPHLHRRAPEGGPFPRGGHSPAISTPQAQRRRADTVRAAAPQPLSPEAGGPAPARPLPCATSDQSFQYFVPSFPTCKSGDYGENGTEFDDLWGLKASCPPAHRSTGQMARRINSEVGHRGTQGRGAKARFTEGGN